MEKTKYVKKQEVEKALAPPKTLRAETQMMPMNGATVPMYAVYGKAGDGRRVWCATFVDSNEAQAWVQASRVFGREVIGAVVAEQEANDGAGKDSGDAAQKPS